MATDTAPRPTTAEEQYFALRDAADHLYEALKVVPEAAKTHVWGAIYEINEQSMDLKQELGWSNDEASTKVAKHTIDKILGLK